MYYPVYGMMHIKEPLLLIGMSSLCSGIGFPLSLSEWSFTICLTPYNRKYNVLSASLNKIFTMILKSDDVEWNNKHIELTSISCLDCVDNKLIHLLIEGHIQYYFLK